MLHHIHVGFVCLSPRSLEYKSFPYVLNFNHFVAACLNVGTSTLRKKQFTTKTDERRLFLNFRLNQLFQSVVKMYGESFFNEKLCSLRMELVLHIAVKRFLINNIYIVPNIILKLM